ncbi:hypothetical protein YC2023_031181 [Brassica napus]
MKLLSGQVNNLLEDQSQVESGPLVLTELLLSSMTVTAALRPHALSTIISFSIKAHEATEEGFLGGLRNQEAVGIVQNHPRNVRLVKMVLRAAAKKREMRYSDLKKIERGVRRHFHDDITVVITAPLREQRKLTQLLYLLWY